MLRLICFILGLMNLYNDQPGAAVFWAIMVIFFQLRRMQAWARRNRNLYYAERDEGFWL